MRRSTHLQRVLLFGCLPWLILNLCGCQLFNPFVFSKEKSVKKIPTATAQDPVIEIICLWEAAEGLGLDDKPTRGFAGKVMFFTKGQREPVRINGDVRIYVFDDLGTEEEQQKPIHHFDFEEGVFQAFLSDSNIGHSYQLFIPYTRKNSYKTNCALRVKLIPPEGRPVYSKISPVTLPGTAPPAQRASNASTQQPTSMIQQASFEQPDPVNKRPTSTNAEAAAYFQSASIPRQQVSIDSNMDRQRLRTAMSRVAEVSEQSLQPEPEPKQTDHPLQRFE